MGFIKVSTGDDLIVFEKSSLVGALASTLNGNQFFMLFFDNGKDYKRIYNGNHSSNDLIRGLKNDPEIRTMFDPSNRNVIEFDDDEGFFLKDYIQSNLLFFRVQDNSQHFTIGFIDGRQYEFHSVNSPSISDLEKIFNAIK